ncbi:unnamed protein product [Caenorhabditis auriculariae]|uniref:C3H1-type domain-containing protein n=1 Tax=Caenorhabditis auriculariae TaxID=2777116 RepID=A0A8S1H3F1_9PELO|nr:unnamed protein product [Caenorhabditis auriculariae]
MSSNRRNYGRPRRDRNNGGSNGGKRNNWQQGSYTDTSATMSVTSSTSSGPGAITSDVFFETDEDITADVNGGLQINLMASFLRKLGPTAPVVVHILHTHNLTFPQENYRNNNNQNMAYYRRQMSSDPTCGTWNQFHHPYEEDSLPSTPSPFNSMLLPLSPLPINANTVFCGPAIFQRGSLHSLYGSARELNHFNTFNSLYRSQNLMDLVNVTEPNWRDRTSSVSSSNSSRDPFFPYLKKTKLCDHWKRNNECAYGDDCWYAHGLRELRQPLQPAHSGFLGDFFPSAAPTLQPLMSVGVNEAVSMNRLQQHFRSDAAAAAANHRPNGRATTNVNGLTLPTNNNNNSTPWSMVSSEEAPLSPAQERWVSMSQDGVRRFGGAEPSLSAQSQSNEKFQFDAHALNQQSHEYGTQPEEDVVNRSRRFRQPYSTDYNNSGHNPTHPPRPPMQFFGERSGFSRPARSNSSINSRNALEAQIRNEVEMKRLNSFDNFELQRQQAYMDRHDQAMQRRMIQNHQEQQRRNSQQAMVIDNLNSMNTATRDEVLRRMLQIHQQKMQAQAFEQKQHAATDWKAAYARAARHRAQWPHQPQQQNHFFPNQPHFGANFTGGFAPPPKAEPLAPPPAVEPLLMPSDDSFSIWLEDRRPSDSIMSGVAQLNSSNSSAASQSEVFFDAIAKATTNGQNCGNCVTPVPTDFFEGAAANLPPWNLPEKMFMMAHESEFFADSILDRNANFKCDNALEEMISSADCDAKSDLFTFDNIGDVDLDQTLKSQDEDEKPEVAKLAKIFQEKVDVEDNYLRNCSPSEDCMFAGVGVICPLGEACRSCNFAPKKTSSGSTSSISSTDSAHHNAFNPISQAF